MLLQAIADQQNNRVFESLKRRYGQQISEDDFESCKFVSTWTALKGYNQDTASFSTYLYKVLNSELIKILEREKRQRKIKAAYKKSQVVFNDNLIDIVDTIDSLPTDMSVIVKQVFIEQKTYKEIMMDYGMSRTELLHIINYAKKRIHNETRATNKSWVYPRKNDRVNIPSGKE